MTTIETDLYVVRQCGEVMFVSLDEIFAEEWDGHEWRDQSQPLLIDLEHRAIPVVPAEIVMWEGSEEEAVLYPHLHYTCPRCRQMQNADLYDADPNPRFACCDSCRWDSLIWLAWESTVAGHPQSWSCAAANPAIVRPSYNGTPLRNAEL
jgi:hypothetical protein